MELENKILKCENLSDLPDEKFFNSIERGIRYKIVFLPRIKCKRKIIGEKWKKKFPDYQIAIHTIESEINIVKLITEKEIEDNQDFFEQCAKDYRKLAERLIREFAKQHGINIDQKNPMNTLNPSGRNGYEQIGMMNNWRYAFHGIHCAFTNQKTHQYIEVPLLFGLEFGELDPYFFSKYINSTKEYKPMPVYIYEDYWDGKRIIDKMVQLGKFEIINTNMPNQTGIVVKDRTKVEIEIYKDVEIIPKNEIKFEVKANEEISFWERIKSKLKRRRTHNNG